MQETTFVARSKSFDIIKGRMFCFLILLLMSLSVFANPSAYLDWDLVSDGDLSALNLEEGELQWVYSFMMSG
jgi:hypothetical protein